MKDIVYLRTVCKVCKVRFRYKLFMIQLQLKCIYIVAYIVNDLYDG